MLTLHSHMNNWDGISRSAKPKERSRARFQAGRANKRSARALALKRTRILGAIQHTSRLSAPLSSHGPLCWALSSKQQRPQANNYVHITETYIQVY